MKDLPRLGLAIVAVAVTVSACTPSKASPTRPSVQQLAEKDLQAQKHLPPLQTAARFCMAGIGKTSSDATVDAALNRLAPPPAGVTVSAWMFISLQGDQVTMQQQFASGNPFTGTFTLGQIIFALTGAVGQQATAGTPDEIQWKLFSLIGPAAIYCAEAALWLDGTVGGQIGVALQKKFLTFSVGQELLASRSSAIAGKWVLYRKLVNCGILNKNNNCLLNPMDVTIACAGTSCTIIRTNGGSGFAPWDHSIPIGFGNGAWQATGTERWAAQCNHAAVPGTGVALALKVTSGQVVSGVWRAQGLAGSYTISNAATSCWAAGTRVDEEVSTMPFTGNA